MEKCRPSVCSIATNAILNYLFIYVLLLLILIEHFYLSTLIEIILFVF